MQCHNISCNGPTDDYNKALQALKSLASEDVHKV